MSAPEKAPEKAPPSLERQSEIVAQVDRLLANFAEQTKLLRQLRETLLLQWAGRFEERRQKRGFEKYTGQWANAAQAYFLRTILPWRREHPDGATKP